MAAISNACSGNVADPHALVFDDLFDIMQSAPEALAIELDRMTQEVRAVEVIAPPPVPPPVMQIEVADFDDNTNILDDGVCNRFATDIEFERADVFTNPQPTTSTLEGYISNVAFHERTLTGIMQADQRVVMIASNYGSVLYPGYMEPVSARSNNRGRKPKNKPKKQRKIQGNGLYFNSQITLAVCAKAPCIALTRDGRPVQLPQPRIVDPWDAGRGYGGRHVEYLAYWLIAQAQVEGAYDEPAVPNDLATAAHDGDYLRMRELLSETPLVFAPIVPSETRLYKFKVFRTGRIQLPGAKPAIIRDVIDAARYVATVLNSTLHAAHADVLRPSKFINMNPVMKNYKFVLKMEPGEILDLSALKTAFCADRERKLAALMISAVTAVSGTSVDTVSADADVLAIPSFNDIRYTREDTKLSVEFCTPIRKRPDKCTVVNIFMRGKINILGARDDVATRIICDYLYRVLSANVACRVVERGVRVAPKPAPVEVGPDADAAVRAIFAALPANALDGFV